MYRIIQTYCWLDRSGQPILPEEHDIVIRQFDSWLQAVLWKFFHYDLIAEPAWKTSFRWQIKSL